MRVIEAGRMITTLQVGSLRGKGPGPPSWLSDRSGSPNSKSCVCVCFLHLVHVFSIINIIIAIIAFLHCRSSSSSRFFDFRSYIICCTRVQTSYVVPSIIFPLHFPPSHSFVQFPFFMLSVRSPKPQMLIPLHLFIVNKSPSSHGLETHSRIVIAGL